MIEAPQVFECGNCDKAIHDNWQEWDEIDGVKYHRECLTPEDIKRQEWISDNEDICESCKRPANYCRCP